MIDETKTKVILKIQVISYFMMIGIFAPGASVTSVECNYFEAMNLTSCGEFTKYNGIALLTYVLFLSLIFFAWMIIDDAKNKGFFSSDVCCVSPITIALYTSLSTLLLTYLIYLLKELNIFYLPSSGTRSGKLIVLWYFFSGINLQEYFYKHFKFLLESFRLC